MATGAINSGSLALGGATLDASANAGDGSTDKGWRAPQLTTAQRNAISSPAAGIFIYNTTSSEYQFYDGSSWVAMANGGGATIRVRKSADESKTSDTSLAADSELVATVVAGENYEFEVALHCTAGSAAPDINIAVDGSGGFAVTNVIYAVNKNGATANAETVVALATGSDFPLTTADDTLFMRGTIEVSTSGTFEIHWAQKNSDANATTVKEGSSLCVCRI